MKFNIEGLDRLRELGESNFGGLFATIGVLLIFFVILIGIVAVILWVFGSVGLMNLAKKHKVPNPWLAFLPIGRSYIIGKLGFEIYDSENKNKTTFMWITLALGAVAFILSDGKGDLHTLVNYALLFFESWGFYNIFKTINPKNSVVFTIFTVITGTLLGGVFLYVTKYDEKVVDEINAKEEKSNGENKEETKTINKKENICSKCGAKLLKEAKFCSNCGTKIK